MTPAEIRELADWLDGQAVTAREIACLMGARTLGEMAASNKSDRLGRWVEQLRGLADQLEKGAR